MFFSDSQERPWRPAIAPYRPRLPGTRAERSSPGQRMLPGIEASDADVPRDVEAQLPKSSEAVCPNCGGTTFDQDGDCTACWEPGVVGRKEESGKPSAPWVP